MTITNEELRAQEQLFSNLFLEVATDQTALNVKRAKAIAAQDKWQTMAALQRKEAADAKAPPTT